MLYKAYQLKGISNLQFYGFHVVNWSWNSTNKTNNISTSEKYTWNECWIKWNPSFQWLKIEFEFFFRDSRFQVKFIQKKGKREEIVDKKPRVEYLFNRKNLFNDGFLCLKYEFLFSSFVMSCFLAFHFLSIELLNVAV